MALVAGGAAVAVAVTHPDVDGAVELVRATSQQRADALAGDRSVLTSLRLDTLTDTATGAQFSEQEAADERALRELLASGKPLQAGSERLEIERGTVEVDLESARRTGLDTYRLELHETAMFPYPGEPADHAMGEAYQRTVTLERTDGGWRILENEVTSEYKDVPPLLQGGGADR